MKAVISMPHTLLAEADNVAARLGISHSELCQRALTRFIEQKRQDIGTALDRTYGNKENRRFDPLIRAAGQQMLIDEAW